MLPNATELVIPQSKPMSDDEDAKGRIGEVTGVLHHVKRHIQSFVLFCRRSRVLCIFGCFRFVWP